jgi:hypothetical protein
MIWCGTSKGGTRICSVGAVCCVLRVALVQSHQQNVVQLWIEYDKCEVLVLYYQSYACVYILVCYFSL